MLTHIITKRHVNNTSPLLFLTFLRGPHIFSCPRFIFFQHVRIVLGKGIPLRERQYVRITCACWSEIPTPASQAPKNFACFWRRLFGFLGPQSRYALIWVESHGPIALFSALKYEDTAFLGRLLGEHKGGPSLKSSLEYVMMSSTLASVVFAAEVQLSLTVSSSPEALEPCIPQLR